MHLVHQQYFFAFYKSSVIFFFTSFKISVASPYCFVYYDLAVFKFSFSNSTEYEKKEIFT